MEFQLNGSTPYAKQVGIEILGKIGRGLIMEDPKYQMEDFGLDITGGEGKHRTLLKVINYRR